MQEPVALHQFQRAKRLRKPDSPTGIMTYGNLGKSPGWRFSKSQTENAIFCLLGWLPLRIAAGMEIINSIRFIDALAEITAHDDRAIIERSLMETLGEYHRAKEYWLYQVMAVKPVLTLGLLAYSSPGGIVISEHAVKQRLSDQLNRSIFAAIKDAEVTIMDPKKAGNDVFVIYPAHDRNKDVFAVLIERTESMDLDSQRLVYGFVRIYTNYLRLIEQARHDKLTGLLNRETLEQEITRVIILNNENIPPGIPKEPKVENDARQYKGELKHWLGVLDIDHFKKINDTFGHLYGDEILILVARLMEKSVRGYDLLFRFGGEEFVILLQAFDLNDARLAFERIRMAVGHHAYAKAEQITVSIGAVNIKSQSGSSEVLEQADQALYYAKDHGRDQVQFYDELLIQGKLQSPQKGMEPGDLTFF